MGVEKLVKEFPSFKIMWHSIGNDDRFESFGEVEEYYNFKMLPQQNLNNSVVKFASEESYMMFVLEWSGISENN